MRLQDRLEAMIKSRDSQIGKLGVRIKSMQNKIDKFESTKEILLNELNSALFMIYGEGHDKAEEILQDALSKEQATWKQ